MFLSIIQIESWDQLNNQRDYYWIYLTDKNVLYHLYNLMIKYKTHIKLPHLVYVVTNTECTLIFLS